MCVISAEINASPVLVALTSCCMPFDLSPIIPLFVFLKQSFWTRLLMLSQVTSMHGGYLL